MVLRLGVTRRPAEIRHGEVVLHERRPFETGVTSLVNEICVDRFTSVRRTLKPAHTLTDVVFNEVPPAAVVVCMYNVTALPLGSRRTTHDAPVVTHE